MAFVSLISRRVARTRRCPPSVLNARALLGMPILATIWCGGTRLARVRAFFRAAIFD